MKDIPIKVNGNYVQANEYNPLTQELKNMVVDSGQTLNESDNFQISKAAANYVASGDFYTDTGGVNTYVLNPQGAKKAPTGYVAGLRARFMPANTNTGVATANVGGLGAKTIQTFFNTPLIGGELQAGLIKELEYDGTNFRLSESHDQATNGFTTGDFKHTIKTVADPGYILYNAAGTIGDASSGASILADLSAEQLYKLIWANTAIGECPMGDAGAKGGTSDIDWVAHRSIFVPAIFEKVLSSRGGGLMASHGGETTHILTVAEMPIHDHDISTNISSYSAPVGGTSALWDGFQAVVTGARGGSVAHNNVQPTCYVNIMMKL